MRSFLLSLLTVLLMPLYVMAAPEESDPNEGFDEAEYMDMDFEENIATPQVDRADKSRVKKYMGRLAEKIARQGYTVEMTRDDEVVIITVPVDKIFMPNDTLLSPQHGRYLNPLLQYLKDPEMFKLVFAVHSDNTGSETYNMDLSQRRVNSVYDWLLDNVNESLIIIPFAMGDTDPLETNMTRLGRAANRRVEFYLIPGPDLIIRARRGKLGNP